MAMARCAHCEEFVDTDEDCDAYKYAVGCLCCSCREVVPETEELFKHKGKYYDANQN